MMILTKEIINRMPGPRGQEGVDDPIVHLKLFNPYGVGTWLVTEAWQIVSKQGSDELTDQPLSYQLDEDEECEQTILFGWAEIGYGFEVGNSDLEEITSLTKFGRPMIEREKWESNGKYRLSQLKKS